MCGRNRRDGPAKPVDGVQGCLVLAHQQRQQRRLLLPRQVFQWRQRGIE